MKLVVTGFEAFGEHTYNPSWEAAQGFVGAVAPNARFESVEAHLLKVTFEEALRDAQEFVGADTTLISFGLAANRDKIEFERFAHNAFERGYLVEGAPCALETRLPIFDWRDAWNAAGPGLEARVSRDAGDYVCNALYFHALRLGREVEGFDAVFVHIPMMSAEKARELGAFFSGLILGRVAR